MASFNILTLVGLKQKKEVTSASTFDFLSIKVGASGLEIKETAGAIDFGSANLETTGTVDGRNLSADGTALDNHVASTANPHSVTKTQVGLANVTNVAQLPLSYLDTDVALAADSDVKVASQKAVKAYVDAQVGGSGAFSDSAFRVQDNADATKQMAFEVSAITTGTTRTITMPNAAVNLGLIASAIQSSEKGANSGVATLDGGGKVPVGQLPSSVMTYEGTFDASATPASPLLDGDVAANAGMVYLANVAGSYNFGAGAISFALGDWAIYNGSIWEKSLNSNVVASVNSQTGVVVLTTSHIAEGSNLYYTTGRFDTAFSGKTTSNLTEGSNLYHTTARAKAAAVADAIVDAVTDVAPSQNAVFDALALKADVSSIITTTASNGVKRVTNDFQRDDAKPYTNDNAGSITVRQVVYIKPNGNVDRALASTINDTVMLGLVQDATIATTASGLITVRRGAIVGGFTGLTPGAEQLVSRASAGVLVEVLTGFVSGEMVYSVGRAISATEIEFDPQFKFEF